MLYNIFNMTEQSWRIKIFCSFNIFQISSFLFDLQDTETVQALVSRVEETAMLGAATAL